MKVHLTQPTRIRPAAWEDYLFGLFRKWLERDPARRYETVADPGQAKLTVLFESNNTARGLAYVEATLGEPVLREFPDRVFCLNHHPVPIGLLSGLYTGMPADRLQPQRHRPWAFQFMANKFAHRTEPDGRTPRYLFTFRGALSHPVRESLLALKVPPSIEARLQHVDRWFDHDDDEQRSYVEEIRDSYFVLCPRGIGASSHRLFETMALGRCPVILSDAWSAVPGVDWDNCSIRVAESDADSLPHLLEARRDDALELGANARRTWLRLFSPANGPRTLLDQLCDLQDRRPPDHDERIAICEGLLAGAPGDPHAGLDADQRDRIRQLVETSLKDLQGPQATKQNP